MVEQQPPFKPNPHPILICLLGPAPPWFSLRSASPPKLPSSPASTSQEPSFRSAPSSYTTTWLLP